MSATITPALKTRLLAVADLAISGTSCDQPALAGEFRPVLDRMRRAINGARNDAERLAHFAAGLLALTGVSTEEMLEAVGAGHLIRDGKEPAHAARHMAGAASRDEGDRS
jgi:hypothetical protein